MSQQNSTTLSWSQILKAITDKTKAEVNTKLIPTVNAGRNTLADALVAFGKSLKK